MAEETKIWWPHISAKYFFNHDYWFSFSNSSWEGRVSNVELSCIYSNVPDFVTFKPNGNTCYSTNMWSYPSLIWPFHSFHKWPFHLFVKKIYYWWCGQTWYMADSIFFLSRRKKTQPLSKIMPNYLLIRKQNLW